MFLNATIIVIDILSMITTTSEKLNGRKYICHLSPVGRQMAIKNTVSNDFWSAFVDSINFFQLPSIRCATEPVRFSENKIIKYYAQNVPGRVVRSVTCLATDECLTADPGAVSSIPA